LYLVTGVQTCALPICWAWGIAAIVIGVASLIGYTLARGASALPADVPGQRVPMPAAAGASTPRD
jgi:hypothetical protein